MVFVTAAVFVATCSISYVCLPTGRPHAISYITRCLKGLHCILSRLRQKMHRYFPSAQHEECISYQPECEARVYIKCILRAMCLCILRDYRIYYRIYKH